MGRPLSRTDQIKLRDAIRTLLFDPDLALSRDARLRWEGALTALEVALGEIPTLAPETLDLPSL